MLDSTCSLLLLVRPISAIVNCRLRPPPTRRRIGSFRTATAWASIVELPSSRAARWVRGQRSEVRVYRTTPSVPPVAGIHSVSSVRSDRTLLDRRRAQLSTKPSFGRFDRFSPFSTPQYVALLGGSPIRGRRDSLRRVLAIAEKSHFACHKS